MRQGILLGIISLILVTGVLARVPKGVQYQGTLARPDGAPMDTTVAMLFELFPDSIGGTAAWSEHHAAVTVANGLFNIRLGWVTEFPDSVLQMPQLWMGISVGDNAEMQPRVKVVSTFFALRSGFTDSLSAENIAQILHLFQTLPDADGDGHTKISMGGDDCDDMNPQIHPGAVEICDGIDNDCDGVVDNGFMTTWYRDADGDGYGNDDSTITSCTPISGYVQAGGDCDDANAAINPGAEDICDLIDNNCNGQVDENGSLGNWYPDLDGDGWGNESGHIFGCPPDSTWVQRSGDCDDNNPQAFPGNAEVCDGVDNDCNGFIDDDAPGCVIYYADADHDNFGNTDDFLCLCVPQEPYTAIQPGDCDDSNPNVHPGATEICNGIDDDCDGIPDNGSTCPEGFICVNGTCVQLPTDGTK